ncbi:hypothetical protein HME9302_02093 [Alteripontixanthobacter maritimus]|uniref:Uncharacterized protein n=1 Tax=Alteripontixanthobacter maritimus TaxID=2161824 RepID=A0A369QCB4_9SPHN|nr:hypothetical protein [Alteripontixanthobacter maritimus]RDC60877.1 hypothetical protein HME9302_02093 [Alteripontixanthobacter maritimus]
MTTKAIPDDAIIADVLPTLNDREEYVRVVLGNLHECQKEHDTCSVRIGITGEGKAPYYRIDYTDTDGSMGLYDSYAGKIAGKGMDTHEDTWSSRSMSKDEVAELLGQIRKRK